MEEIMRNLSYNIVYKAGGAKHVYNSESCEHFSLNVEKKDNILSVAINPKCPISFEKFDIILPYTYSNNDKIFVNGY